MGLRPREAVKTLAPYQPAKSIDSVKREFGFETVIKLAGNENTLGFSSKVLEAVQNAVPYYPDPEAISLKTKLAQKFQVKTEQIIFGNGSFELLQMIGLAFLEQGDESIIAEPSFNWYKNVTRIMGAKLVSVPLDHFKVNLDWIRDAVTEKTKVIWLCNPNNPTGTIFTQQELEEFLSEIRDDIVVVLDEAYYDFATEEGYPESIPLLKQYDNIVILRTFSKLDGLAFFRLGYGIGSEELIGYLNRVRMPINTNGAAHLAADAAFEDKAFEKRTLQNVRDGLALYYQVLDKWGLPYVRSNTNFILFEVGVDSLYVEQKLREKGVLIRAGAEFGYPTMLRVSIGTPEENQTVLRLLAELLNKEL